MIESASPSVPALQTLGISHRYGDRLALSEVFLEVRRGEIFGLLGPNGGGKSTLFRLLTTSLPTSPGKAFVGGFDVATQTAEVRRRIGVVFQHPSLDKKLTVAENLKHHGRLFGMSDIDARARMGEMLNRFGLIDRKNDRVEKLSGGLARRVELAKGMLHRPELLILDEPSTGLDPGARMDLWHYLRQAQTEGITILLTTHWMEEAERCDRIGILNEGKLVAFGTPEQLRSEVGGDVVVLRGGDPRALAKRLESELRLKANVVEDTVQIESTDGFAIAGKVAAAFGASLQSLTVSKPTLEDVFVKKTGRRFWMNGVSQE